MRKGMDEFDDWRHAGWGRTTLYEMPDISEAENELFPPAKVLNDEDGFLLLAEMPDCGREDVRIAFRHGLLELSGCCRGAHPAGFHKTFRLPGAIRAEDIHVWFESGFLFAWLPKYK